MRGITEEELKKFKNSTQWCQRTLQDLLAECTELNPWQPIETAPLGKKLRLFNGECQLEGKLYEETDRKYFTHWQELPKNP